MIWKTPAKVEEISPLGKTEKFSIRIRKVAEVSFNDLFNFVNRKTHETEKAIQCSNVLSVVLRHIPSMLFTSVGPNFFTPEARVPVKGGLEIWRGYHQSVKAMMAGHLGINIDIASCVFRKGFF
jgi:eukaryotic translation initiation factor 2C